MMQSSFSFQSNSKFALLAIKQVDSRLPHSSYQLSDGTWILPKLPVGDLGIWEKWIGSLRRDRLKTSNVVFLRDEISGNPEVVDKVHWRLKNDVWRLFQVLQFSGGLQYQGADLLSGSVMQDGPEVRDMSEQPNFIQSKGYDDCPLTQSRIDLAATLSTIVDSLNTNTEDFDRFSRGLDRLLEGLQIADGQDRLHHFVRSIEALILPDQGKAKRQFAHRCKTFTNANADADLILEEAYDMRSHTEHLHPWDKLVQKYPSSEREDRCWQRTRQMERLSCFAYSRILQDAVLREQFRCDQTIAAFWKLKDHERSKLWGNAFDLDSEPLFQDQDYSSTLKRRKLHPVS